MTDSGIVRKKLDWSKAQIKNAAVELDKGNTDLEQFTIFLGEVFDNLDNDIALVNKERITRIRGMSRALCQISDMAAAFA